MQRCVPCYVDSDRDHEGEQTLTPHVFDAPYRRHLKNCKTDLRFHVELLVPAMLMAKNA